MSYTGRSINISDYNNNVFNNRPSKLDSKSYMVRMNNKNGDRSPSPGSRDGPRISSSRQVPYAEITLIDRVTNRDSPPTHFEKHFS